MKTYRLTVDFTGDDVTIYDIPRFDESDRNHLKSALAELKGADIKSFRLDRLDESGKRIKTPKCFTVDSYSVEEQCEILKAQQ